MLLCLWPLGASATTYYVCSVTTAPFNASDANAGTSPTATWLHAPGMSTFTGTYTHAAGDHILFCGGGIWHLTSGSPLIGTYTWTHSGTSIAIDYIGVDVTFFTGGSWTRPIFTMDNTPTNSQPGACPTASDSGSSLINVANQSWITIDNLELTGGCSNSSGGSYISYSGATHLTISNNYCHGITYTTNVTSDTFRCFNGNLNTTTNTGNAILSNVLDNADGTWGNRYTQTHTASCTGTNDGINCAPTTGTPTSANAGAVGWGVSEGYTIAYNVFRHLSNPIETGNTMILHDNLEEYNFEPNGSNPHGNVFEMVSGVSGDTGFYYNNIFRNNSDGVTIWPQADTGYWYNNTVENDWHNGGSPNAQFFSPTGLSNVGKITNWIFCGNTSDNTVYYEAYQGNGTTPHWASGSTATLCNMYILGRTSLTSFFQIISPSVATIINNGGIIFQTVSAANGQGYNLANDFSPQPGCTPATCTTVQAGSNESSLSGPTIDFLSGTTKGCAEATGSGGLVSSCPAITPNARGTTWDSGSNQFQAGSPQAATPSCAPGSGTYSSSQSVNCSDISVGAIMCYTSNGTTPASNGSTGCSNGTLYSSAITIASTSTLHVIAGGTGYTDSSVASYSYTISSGNGVVAPPNPLMVKMITDLFRDPQLKPQGTIQ